MLLPRFLWSLCLLVVVRADVTIYGQVPLAQTVTTAIGAATTTFAAYNDSLLVPPAVPTPAPATSYTVAPQRDAATVSGISIRHTGAGFWGFSIEMSVINQVLGRNSSYVAVPFLNLMQNLVERAGGVYIRLGGNTQEHAKFVDSIENGKVITKEKTGLNQTTDTPAVLYSYDMFYLMNNISSLVNVKWFLGVPYDDKTNWRLTIAELAEAILKDNLIGFQAGNEPDFYNSNGLRDNTYTPYDYFGDFGSMLAAVDANPAIQRKNLFIAPSLGGGGNGWTPEQIEQTGFIDSYVDRLCAMSVEHYPMHNCAFMFNTGDAIVIPQDVFHTYLTHKAGQDLAAPYLAFSMVAQQHNRPFIMFETNSASCGGFQGISDSYGGALWALDYGLQLAYSNFTNALMHIGGQNVFYNAFTSPPTNQSLFNEWTVGAVYYSTLVIAEAFGKSNTSQIVDMYANGDNEHTPAYAIYENGEVSKFALFNYVDDKTGASDVVVTITIQNGAVPSSVKVKYLAATSVSVKNMTWAGQTFGSKFNVDGRLKGDLNVTTIVCDATSNTCRIPVKAPGFALVFLNDSDPVLKLGQATQTYATTAQTRTVNTATVDLAALSTSNGHSERERVKLAHTSYGSVGAAEGRRALIPGAALLGMFAGGTGVIDFLW